jgi:hypothetical protein
LRCIIMTVAGVVTAHSRGQVQRRWTRLPKAYLTPRAVVPCTASIKAFCLGSGCGDNKLRAHAWYIQGLATTTASA